MAKNYKVFKRNGEKVQFDVMKIKKVIAWACVGIEVNPLELESQVHLKMQNNIKTSDIQETLISTALTMVNTENLNNLKWKYVAARLSLLNLYKEAKRTRGYDTFGYGSYYVFVKKAVESNIYDKIILEEYSKEELQKMGRERKMWFDFDYDFAGMNLLKNRYLLKSKGKIFELPQDMYLSIALFLAIPEKKENRLKIAKKLYNVIASRKISLATPIILNLRRPNGNLASCFITSIDDSLDSIYYSLDQLAQISKNAGGVGVNISKIRSSGSSIKGVKGASGGVLPWIKLINDTAVAVNQLGSRAGAITVALDIWHMDIELFLDMQTENGDQRKKSYDIFPQIVIPDLFLKRVEENLNWTLIDPFEIKNKYNLDITKLYGEEFEKIYLKIEKDETLEFKKIINSKNLMKSILKVVVETGMPYIFFKDTVNNLNPNKHCGMIGNSNLCTESFSNFIPSEISKKVLSKDKSKIEQEIITGEVHTCNLVSLNLALIENDEDLDEIISLAVRILDNTLEITSAPLPEAEKHNLMYRILGVGSLGLADWLVKRGYSYQNSGDIIEDLFEKIAISGTKASALLSKERGSYPKFKGSEWQKGIFYGKSLKKLKEISKYYEEWVEIKELIGKFGIRNGGIFAIAPNTSSSLLVGSTASVLPIYKKFFVDKSSNGVTPISPPFLNDETFWTYIENQNINQNKIIEIISRIQNWTDQGISMELILNLKDGIKAKDIYNLYMDAWKKGCKTVYYVRSITKTAQNGKSDCISCAN